MDTHRKQSGGAQKAEHAFRRADVWAGRVWARTGALICFAVAVWQLVSAFQNRAQFETIEHYVGTAVFIGLFLVAGFVLWTRRQRLSDAVDDAGQARRGG